MPPFAGNFTLPSLAPAAGDPAVCGICCSGAQCSHPFPLVSRGLPTGIGIELGLGARGWQVGPLQITNHDTNTIGFEYQETAGSPRAGVGIKGCNSNTLPRIFHGLGRI
ncbi:hypothetical protein BO82DRAFT_134675 [Aspergillus uvarum CBS 121591]|uniref:Uncharacterized protein n=1 Tax=Aspergillus uvarum CBS 121591 TaxID=1448315 RepID=A0A319C5T3_9EURO|nr:hypothetical protein BO82DRAFT_134675 [Aspergillus uvarum CBS 121591]PYH79330.1 hypothetical protein BO82DRAFT_134675 [Aspergillus uvarum CBS 121591]